MRSRWPSVRQQAFSRASGAPLREGNAVRLLRDASENYPAWLEAIQSARRTVHFEMYIIHDDAQGRLFADTLIAKAREGVHVRVLYDWMGGFGKTPSRFWRRLRAAGVEVRCYNPPRLHHPIGWISRDHRKTISIDGAVAFVTGLCIGEMWAGEPAWRDTGIEVRGPAVADIEAAFVDGWVAAGGTPPLEAGLEPPLPAGDVAVRIVATVPNMAGLFRVDQLVAATARRTLWLTDAYYGGTAPYMQALRAAALDDVDVRLLLPGTSDLVLARSFSRAGYRPLLEAGVRIFEWNGPMIHAKTAVADGRWARVGSTNLNIASWMGNRELDAIIEHRPFAREMEQMFLEDLGNATEIVLQDNRVRAFTPRARRHRGAARGASSGGRVVAGAIRVGNTVATAISQTQVLHSAEAAIPATAGAILALLALLAFVFPRSTSYLLGVVAAWLAAVLIARAFSLYARGRHDRRRPVAQPVSPAATASSAVSLESGGRDAASSGTRHPDAAVVSASAERW